MGPLAPAADGGGNRTPPIQRVGLDRTPVGKEWRAQWQKPRSDLPSKNQLKHEWGSRKVARVRGSIVHLFWRDLELGSSGPAPPLELS